MLAGVGHIDIFLRNGDTVTDGNFRRSLVSLVFGKDSARNSTTTSLWSERFPQQSYFTLYYPRILF